jgi:hypothetical protein
MDRHVSCHQTNMSKYKKSYGTCEWFPAQKKENAPTSSPLRILVVRVLEQCFPRLEGHNVSYQPTIMIMITYKRGKAPKATPSVFHQRINM